MAAFEAFGGCGTEVQNDRVEGTAGRRTVDECVISLKVYDFCRLQECLTPEMIGPARAAADSTYCGITVDAGDIIRPPEGAASVSVENLKAKQAIIISKAPNPFRAGYWDIEIKYIFCYRLVFRDVNGDELCSVMAQSSFNNRMTMFGSTATETLVSTDLLASGGNSADMEADPFVLIESKGVALAAEIDFKHCCCDDTDPLDDATIDVTIGLFSIVKLFRLVNLVVESKGFCIPEECEDVSAVDACEFFESLDFPMDIFAPPQRAEFTAGVSANIPAEVRGDSDRKGCGCGCGKNK